MLLCILYIVYVTTYIETSKPNHFSRVKKKGRKTLNNTKGDAGDTECNI